MDIPAKTPVDLKTAERIAERVGLGLSYQEAGGAKGAVKRTVVRIM